MRKKFDTELGELHEELVVMASMAETAISSTVQALKNKDQVLAQKVIGNDDAIDEKEKEIERRCLKLLLQQQPVAKDLRNVSAALKMITDIERIGDQAADIAEIVVFLCNNGEFDVPEGLPEMARMTIQMVRGAIDAFITEDLDKANKVIKSDDEVDEEFIKTRDQLIDQIHNTDISGQNIMDLLMITKYFERIGDHAVNTAEWVIFAMTGKHKSIQVI